MHAVGYRRVIRFSTEVWASSGSMSMSEQGPKLKFQGFRPKTWHVTSTLISRRQHFPEESQGPTILLSDGSMVTWEEMINEFAPAVAGYARARGVREPDDLVQDVFLAVVERLPGFRGDRGGLRSFIFTIAYRRIADEHRRRFRRRETLVAEHAPLPDPGPPVEDVVHRQDLTKRAMQAFTVLTPTEQRVVEMRFLGENSPSEVGRSLGLTTGNVRVIQARALVKVRKYLADEGIAARWFVTPLVFVRGLRGELPGKGFVGDWLRELHTHGSGSVTADPRHFAGLVSDTTVVERLITSSQPMVTSFVGSGIARLGAVFSVVALSVTGAAVDVGSDGATRWEAMISPVEVHDIAPAPTPRILEPLKAPHSETPDSTTPASLPTGPVQPGHTPESTVRPSPVDEGTSKPPTEAPDRPADDGAESSLADVAPTPGIDEAVVPLVEATLETVDDVVGLVVDDVAIPLIQDSVQPLVENTIDTVVDGVVVPLVEDVVDPLVGEAATPLVGAILDGTVKGISGLLTPD